jgi:hypothetical protein
VIWVEGRTCCSGDPGPAPATCPPAASGHLQQVLETRQPLYLGDLRFFPARAEFDGLLPPGSQAVLCQPIGQRGCLILGSDRPRSFSRQERAWVAAIADKLEALFA